MQNNYMTLKERHKMRVLIEKHYTHIVNDPDGPLFKDAFLVEHKYDYIKKEGKYKNATRYEEQNERKCTICSIVQGDKNVPSYEIYRNENFIVFLNLFPYTSGHLLISPLQHFEEYETMPDGLIAEFGKEVKRAINLVKNATRTNSVNVGWNQGPNAGGSIKHFHAHVVPRFPREMNFIEIIAHSRPMIVSLEKMQEIYKKALEDIK